MKYRYLILPENGDVWGTNDLPQALIAAESDLVIDVATDEMVDEDDDREDIDQYEPPEDPEEEDE
jgi:hypothetical protein